MSFRDHLKCYWLIAKWNWNLNGESIFFSLCLVLLLIIVVTILITFLLSKTQNCIFPSLFYHRKTIKSNQIVSGKVFERSVYWSKYKAKSKKKDTTNEYKYFLESNFAGINRLVALIYSNVTNDAEGIIYQTVSSKIVTLASMEKTSMTIDSDIKWYEEIRKLTTWQGEDFTTGC